MPALSVRTDYIDLLKSEAIEYDVDPVLADAIIHCESSWNPWAVRFEPSFDYFVSPEKFAQSNHISVATEKNCQKTSFGLGQVIGATARWLSFTGPLTSLLDPEYGIEYCLKFLHQLGGQYSRIEDIAAAYNAGSVKHTTDGKYVNQKYVDKVMSVYAHLLDGK